MKIRKISSIGIIFILVFSLMITPLAFAKDESISILNVSQTSVVKGSFGKLSIIERSEDGIVKKSFEKENLLSQPGTGCCANPLIRQSNPVLYCAGSLSQVSCCPETSSGYSSTNTNSPINQADCLQNYYDEGLSCSESITFNKSDVNTKCYSGCCYDVTQPPGTKCDVSQTHDVCSTINLNNFWAPGDEDTNPCLDDNMEFIYGICEERTNECDSITTSTSCTENPNCYWCGHENDCFSSCYQCEGYTNHDTVNRLCEQEAAPSSCTNGQDDDGNFKTDDDDFCCYAYATSSTRQENSNCACPPSNKINTELSQCTDVSGITVGRNEYNVSTQGTYGCCSEPVRQTAACLSASGTYGVKLNLSIKDELYTQQISADTYTGNYCQCGSTLINVSNATDQNYGKYCCRSSDSISSLPCTNNTLQGYVRDNSGNPIPDARITLTRLGQPSFTISTLSSNQPQNAGFYRFFNIVPGGIYKINVSKSGYQENITNSYSIDENAYLTITENFILTYLGPVTGKCKTDFTNTNPIVTATNQQCDRNLMVQWTYQCNSSAESYEIYRKKQGETEFKKINTVSKTASSYEDNNIITGNNYTYQIKAILPQYLNAPSASLTGTSPQIYSGDELCFEKACNGDVRRTTSPLNSFCLNPNENNKKINCDAGNKIDDGSARDCSEGIICKESITQTRYTSYCADLTFSCKDIGTQEELPNIFGLYYYDKIGDCLSQQREGVCYYDSSNTTADVCSNCNSISSCFDYKSEFACIDSDYRGDQCEVYQGDCEWYSNITNYAEYGKGLCYEPDYNATDKCSLCGPGNGLFGNANCTPQICNNLGACYSADQTRCSDCATFETGADITDEVFTSCYTYQDEYSCLGQDNQNFNIPGSPSAEHFTYSGDSCSLGVCKYDETRDFACFKDANNDGIDDCDSMSENDIEYCRRDYSPPLTMITDLPATITNIGSLAKFNITDKGWGELHQNSPDYKLNYCLSNTSATCNSFIMAIVNSTPQILLSPDDIDSIKNQEGWFYIRYFSEDNFSNVETIKNSGQFYVDTKGPEVNISYNVNKTGQCKLNVDINVSQHSNCTADLWGEIPNPISSNFLIDSNKSLEYPINMDGFHLFNVSCKDDNGNINQTRTSQLTIDCHPEINAIPQGQAYNLTEIQYTGVTVRANLSSQDDQYNCQIGGQTMIQSQPYANFVVPYFISLTQANGDFILNNETYKDVICTGLNTGQELKERISFIVDSNRTTTQIRYRETDGWKNISEIANTYRSGTINISLNCIGDSYFATENDCEQTFWCNSTTLSASSCSLQSDYLSYDGREKQIDSSRRICAYSVDAKGNSEFSNCGNILIDNTRPSIYIDVPADQWIYGLGPVNQIHPLPQGRYDTNGGASISEINITYWNDSRIIRSVAANQINSSNWQAIFVINPFLGINTLTAYIKDQAGNDNTATTHFYVDNFPPEILSFKINNTDSEPVILEYGQQFYINVTVNDTRYTARDLTRHINTVKLKISLDVLSNSQFNLNNLNCPDELILTETPDTSSTAFSAQISSSVLQSCLLPGNFTFTLIAQDSFIWSGNKSLNITINDSTAPRLSVMNITPTDPTIFGISQNADGNYTVGLGEYYIFFNSTEPVTIDQAYFNVSEGGISKQEQLTLMATDGTTFKYVFSTSPSYDSIYTLFNNARANLTLIGHDENGLQTTPLAYKFYIDGKGPDAPLISSPANNTVLKQNRINVSGREKTRTPNVEVALQNGPIIYRVQSGAQANFIGKYPISTEAAAQIWSSNQLLISPISTLGINHYLYNISIGNYISCNANEDLFYKITNIEPYGTEQYIITVDRDIESVSCQIFNVSSTILNTGSYLFEYVNLNPGENRLEIYAKDALKNQGITARLFIYLDNQAPRIISTYPTEGTIFGNTDTNITAIVDTTMSGLKSFSFIVQNSTNSAIINACNTPASKYNRSVSGGEFYYELGCNPTNNLQGGNYTINLSITDMADNTNQTSWWFIIDPSAPRQESIQPGKDSYVNTTRPRIVLNFTGTDNRDELDLNSVVIFNNQGYMRNITEKLISYSESNPLLEYYTYILDSQDELWIQSQGPSNPYYLNITGTRKIYTSTDTNQFFYGGSIVIPMHNFMLDTIAPIITSIAPNNIATRYPIQEISLQTNEAVEGCRWSLEDQNYYQMMPENNFTFISGNTYKANITLNDEDGTFNYYISCIDLAGNANTANRTTIKRDSTGPSIEIDALPSLTKNNLINITGRIVNVSEDLGSTAKIYVSNNTNSRNYGISYSGGIASISVNGFTFSTNNLTVLVGKNLSITNTDSLAVRLISDLLGGTRILNPGQSLNFKLEGINADIYTIIGDYGLNSNVSTQINLTDTFSQQVQLNNGDNRVTAIANDSLGNQGEPFVTNIYVDNQAPRLFSSYPWQGETVGNPNLAIEVVVSDDHGVNGSIISTLRDTSGDDVPIIFNDVQCDNPCTFISEQVSLQNNTNYTLNVTYSDLAGNTNTSIIRFRTDTNTPSFVMNITPSIEQPYTNSSTPNITFIFNYPINVSTLSATIDSHTLQLVPTISQTQFTFRTIQGFDSGTYYLQVNASRPDNVGSQLSEIKWFIVDLESPIISNASVENAYNLSGLFLTNDSFAMLNIQINETNLKRILINNAEQQSSTINGNYLVPVELIQGLNNFNITAEDKAGNRNNKTISIYYDAIKPRVTITNPTNRQIVNANTQITGTYFDEYMRNLMITGDISNTNTLTDLARNASTTFTATANIFGEGIRRINVIVNDYANWQTRASVDVIHDSTGPTIKETVPSEDATLAELTTYKIVFNREQYESSLDFSRTTASLIATAEDPDRTVNINLRNNGIDTLFVDIPGGIAASQQLPSSFYTLTLDAYDMAGNINQNLERHFIIDKNAPSATWIYPTQTIYTNNSQQSLNLTITPRAGTNITSVLVNTEQKNHYLSQNRFNYPVTLSNNQNQFTVRVVSNLSNFWEDSKTMIYDAAQPSVSIIKSSYSRKTTGAYYTLTPEIEVIGTAGDNIKLNDVKIYVNDEFKSSNNLIDALHFRADINLTLVGENTITAVAIDEAGNSREDSFTIDYDNLGPGFSRIEPLTTVFIDGKWKTNLSYVIFEGNYTDEHVSVTSISHSTLSTQTFDENKTFLIKVQLNTQNNNEVENKIILQVKDDVGKIFRSGNISIWYDGKGPTINLMMPPGATNNARPELIINLSESAKDINSCFANYTSIIAGVPTTRNEMFSALTTNILFAKNLSYNLEEGKANLVKLYCHDHFGNLGTNTVSIYVERAINNTPEISTINVLGGIQLQGAAMTTYILAQESTSGKSTTQLTVTARDDDVSALNCRYGTDSSYDSLTGMSAASTRSGNYTITTARSEFIDLDDGTSTIFNFICRDRTGKTSAMMTVNVTVDLNYPVQIFNITPSGATNDNTPLIKVLSDVASNCEVDNHNMLSTAGAGYYIHTYQSGILTENLIYSLPIECSANGRATGQANVVFIVDTTSPLTPIIYSNTTNTTTALISIHGDAREQGLRIVPFINGIQLSYNITSGTTQFDFDNILITNGLTGTINLLDGTALLTVKTYDAAGNIAQSAPHQIIYVKNLGPEIQINPRHNSIVPQANTINISITKNRIAPVTINLSSINITIDSETDLQAQISQNINQDGGYTLYSYESRLPNGNYTVHAKASNTEGIETEKVIIFSVDDRVPNIEFSSMIPELTNVSSQRINATITNDQNITSIAMIYRNIRTNITFTRSTEVQISPQLNLALQGDNLIEIEAANSIGAIGRNSINIELDTIIPIAKVEVGP